MTDSEYTALANLIEQVELAINLGIINSGDYPTFTADMLVALAAAYRACGEDDETIREKLQYLEHRNDPPQPPPKQRAGDDGPDRDDAGDASKNK